MEAERAPQPPAQDPPPSAASSSGTGGGGGEKGAPCEECGKQPWKYRCPGCSRLTCSLPCVQAHKRRTACSGKRPRTDPVPLSQFDDNQLLSDYNLLEETNQVRESAHRLIVGFGRNYGRGDGANLPSWLFFLRKAANRRGVRLFFLPRGMTRREQNRSRHFNRKYIIYWTIEWRFNSTDIFLTDHQGLLVIYAEDQWFTFAHTATRSYTPGHLSLFVWGANVDSYGDAMDKMLEVLTTLEPMSSKHDGMGLEDREKTSDKMDTDSPMKSRKRAAADDVDFGAPIKKGAAGRPTAVRDKAPYENPVKQTRFCSIFRKPGHKNTTCPNRGDVPKPPRKDPRCSKCGLRGHRRNSCVQPVQHPLN